MHTQWIRHVLLILCHTLIQPFPSFKPAARFGCTHLDNTCLDCSHRNLSVFSTLFSFPVFSLNTVLIICWWIYLRLISIMTGKNLYEERFHIFLPAFDSCKSLIFEHFRGIYDWSNLKWDKAYQAKILCLDISNHKWKYLRQQQWEKIKINLNIMSTSEIKRSKTKQKIMQAKINQKSKACLFKFLSEFICDAIFFFFFFFIVRSPTQSITNSLYLTQLEWWLLQTHVWVLSANIS